MSKENHLFESKMMKCGLIATIIEWYSPKNITVEFDSDDDEIIRSHVTYKAFLSGKIDTEPRNIAKQRIQRVGTTNVMANGMKATIIIYNSSLDCTVQFEDGAIKKRVTYEKFMKGNVQHPSLSTEALAQQRVGQFVKQKNGLNAELKAFRRWDDCDVLFEDGTLVTGCRYEKFKNGDVPNPNYRYMQSFQEFAIEYYLRNYGFRKIRRGEWKNRGFGHFELDFYNEEKQIAIEYDGGMHAEKVQYENDIKKNIKCEEFGIKLYRIRSPYLNTPMSKGAIIYTIDKSKRITDRLYDCSEELKTILTENNISFNSDSMDFFRDLDKITEEYNGTYFNYYAKERIGETSIHKVTGQQMIIVDYKGSNDVTVQFEDGTIIPHVTYRMFQKGYIRKLPKTGKSYTESSQ